MKLQIDTTNKSIKIENDIKLEVLISNLKKMFPNNEWKKFTLVTNTIIEHWSSPVIIKSYPYQYPYPWYSTPTNYRVSAAQTSLARQVTDDKNYQLIPGVYNVTF